MLPSISDIISAVKWHLGPKPKYIPQPKLKPVIIKPKKPRIHLKVDITKAKSWKGAVWHHTGDNDDPLADEYNRILYYQTSFRIDYHIIAGPVSGNINPGVKLVAYGREPFVRWYKKSEVDEFNRRKSKNIGTKFQKPWSTTAYNIISEYINREIYMHYGRPFHMSGAHSGTKVNGKVNSYYNRCYLGLCQMGNFNIKRVPKIIWNHSLAITRSCMDIWGFGTDKILGHGEVYDKLGVPRKKECPGTNWNMNKFRKEL